MREGELTLVYTIKKLIKTCAACVYGAASRRILVLKDSATITFSGSWFHTLMVDRKNDSLWTVVRQNGILYRCWCPRVTAPVWLNWGGSWMATKEFTTRYIMVALVLALRWCRLSHSYLSSLWHYWCCSYLSRTELLFSAPLPLCQCSSWCVGPTRLMHILPRVWPLSCNICPWWKLDRMKGSSVRRLWCYLLVTHTVNAVVPW